MINKTECGVDIALELVTTGIFAGDDGETLSVYAQERLLPLVDDPELMIQLVTVLAAVASSSVEEWADDTDRDPAELIQAIARAYKTAAA